MSNRSFLILNLKLLNFCPDWQYLACFVTAYHPASQINAGRVKLKKKNIFVIIKNIFIFHVTTKHEFVTY